MEYKPQTNVTKQSDSKNSVSKMTNSFLRNYNHKPYVAFAMLKKLLITPKSDPKLSKKYKENSFTTFFR